MLHIFKSPRLFSLLKYILLPLFFKNELGRRHFLFFIGWIPILLGIIFGIFPASISIFFLITYFGLAINLSAKDMLYGSSNHRSNSRTSILCQNFIMLTSISIVFGILYGFYYWMANNAIETLATLSLIWVVLCYLMNTWLVYERYQTNFKLVEDLNKSFNRQEIASAVREKLRSLDNLLIQSK